MAYKSSIIACGFDVDISDVTDFIKNSDLIKSFVNFGMDYIPDSIKSGIMYNPLCKGGLDDVKGSEIDMRTWHKKFSKDAGLIGYCKKIWFSHHFIALEITSSRNHRFYSIVYSTGNSTTQLKKIITTHPDTLQKIDCDFKLALKAYLHESTSGSF